MGPYIKREFRRKNPGTIYRENNCISSPTGTGGSMGLHGLRNDGSSLDTVGVKHADEK